MLKILSLFVVLTLSACGARDIPAPVYELGWTPFNGNARVYIVRPGDTLYSIAFRYDADYKYLAQINNIPSPYHLHIGQRINLESNNKQQRKLKTKSIYINPKNSAVGAWLWPASGNLKSSFAPFAGRKGIDIAGKRGNKIRAANSGVVAYAGNGLENYGNLIIVKHPNNFLTAYGNNAKNLVKEGQRVRAGQIIADMGVVNHKYYGLHFEIRQHGKPVNPLQYLKKSTK